MKKIAIIVQRCHESVVGGSEALAWQYAGSTQREKTLRSNNAISNHY